MSTKSAVRPFEVHVPDAVLDDLRQRIARTRWPDEVAGAGWRYGTDLAYLRELCAYWRERYDWRAHEARLNGFRQFTVPLAGIDVHFIHEEGVGPRPLPLLLSHGWPGSVWEFNQLMPRLTDPARFGGDPADAFTVVAPSLPGYGFSFRSGQPRFGVPEIAEAFATLMTDVLGYRRFGAQGGDWGSFVSARLAVDRPDRLVGIHLNLMPLRRDVPRDTVAQSAEDARTSRSSRNGCARKRATSGSRGRGPRRSPTASRTRPPGWRRGSWRSSSAGRDCDGDVERSVSRDDLLTNVMIYWVTGAINASFWPYYDRMHRGWPLPEGRIEVPTGYAAFPREILRPPRAWAERAFDHPPMDADAARRPLRGPGGAGPPGRGRPRLLPAPQRSVTMAWPRPLISPAELAARLDAPELRLFECGVVYRPLPGGGDFRVESARPLYDAGHLPGAVFVDPVAELSDSTSGLRFTMPGPARVAEAFGRQGSGPAPSSSSTAATTTSSRRGSGGCCGPSASTTRPCWTAASCAGRPKAGR